MSRVLNLKHFIVTIDKGRIFISRAQEVVPNHIYEIIQPSKPFMEWNIIVTQPLLNSLWTKSVVGIGLGETLQKKSTLE